MPNRANETVWSLVRRLCHLLHSWWKRDRIRISPTEGSLLRLQAPCVVIVGEEAFEIVDRQVREDSDGPTVIYSCRGLSGLGRLTVQWTPEGSGSVHG